MSKTDKTRPFKVQALETLTEVHDHSDGECNLPTPEEWLHMSIYDRRTWKRHNCYYEPRNWHTDVTFSRYKGEKEHIKNSKHRKDKHHSVEEGLQDYRTPDDVE